MIFVLCVARWQLGRVEWGLRGLIDRDGLDKHFLHCSSDESIDKLWKRISTRR